MYYLGVKHDFSSAHHLKDYDGKCSNLHGHNWIVEAVFKSEKLNSIYLSVDFTDLKKILRGVLEEFDHKYLNEMPEFSDKNPSAEVISELIFNKIDKELKKRDLPAEVYEIKVWETEKNWVCFRK